MTRPTTTGQAYKLSFTLFSLLLCSMVVATPTTHTTTQAINSTLPPTDLKVDENYLCPVDCHCVLARNTHKPLLHAKCSSLKGLKAEQPLQATLPLHSIDLSFLNLTRLEHSLEKLPDLTSIDLSHNELHEIGHLGRRIKKLNLKHNRLNSSKLSKLPQHVQSLNLQHNDITNLPLEFTKLHQLQSLELAHNQINCSCETLEVRNWLQERHVFMEHPVKCFSPALYKGKSWLQVKQTLVCEKEKRLGYNVAEEEENELMMGDQPFEASGDEVQDEEELGKDYMPIDTNTKKTTSAVQSSALTMMNDVEGSGDLSEMSLPLDMLVSSTQSSAAAETTTEIPEEDDEGSGSGGGLLFIPAIQHERVLTDDFDIPESKEDKDDDDDDDDMNDNKPIEEPAINPDIFHHSLGIFDGDEKPRPSTEEPEIVEEDIKPVDVPTLGEGNEPATEGPDAVAHAKIGESKDDSNATYFLLGVIGLIVIGLLFYVAIKRCKHSGHGNDPENPQTELIDMDKKQLGKPLRNGVPEHVPLIGEKTKSDMAKPINGSKPYDADTKDGPTQNEPLLNGNGNANANGNGAVHAEEPEDSRPGSQLQAPHEYYPISPRYPPPQSPRASKYSQQPQQAEPNNNDPNQPYLPSSPKSGRYSPVYSPETGRVKIKLSETPRPKTPMLVTRSRSNAGDIITTPVRPTQTESFQATPIHTAATNGHAVGGH